MGIGQAHPNSDDDADIHDILNDIVNALEQAEQANLTQQAQDHAEQVHQAHPHVDQGWTFDPENFSQRVQANYILNAGPTRTLHTEVSVKDYFQILWDKPLMTRIIEETNQSITAMKGPSFISICNKMVTTKYHRL